MFGLFNNSAAKKRAEYKHAHNTVVTLLSNLNTDYDTQPDGSFVVHGSIDLTNRNLTELPDFSKVVVEGSFLCGYNQLKSLKGAPRVVKGSFVCSHNQLFSLEHGPEEAGEYYCQNNFLKNLKGAPRRVEQMDCSNNGMTSLEGAPQDVDGSFRATNTSIEHLTGGPRRVGVEYDATSSPLKDLRGLPGTFHRLVTDLGVFTSHAEISPALAMDDLDLTTLDPEGSAGSANNKDAGSAPGAPENVSLDAPLQISRPLTFAPRRAGGPA